MLRSASMEPAYRTGSLVLADTKIRPEQTRPGDVLIYRSCGGNLVMHRLVAENSLKGDANQTTENVVLTNDNLIGIAVCTIANPLFNSDHGQNQKT